MIQCYCKSFISGSVMKKKIICLLLVIVLSVCLVGLVGCDFSGLTGLFKNEEQTQIDKSGEKDDLNGNKTPNEEEEIPSGGDETTEDDETDDGSEEESNPTENISLVGKNFAFDNVVLSLVKIWVSPNEIEKDEDSNYMPTDEEMQMYADYIADEYAGVILAFKEDGVLQMIYSDDRENQEYLYKQTAQEIKIGYYEIKQKFGKEIKIWTTALTAEITSQNEIVIESVIYTDNELTTMVVAELKFILYEK